jgi:hypothetical protein
LKRSEVPGAAFGMLCKSPPEINDETMRGEGKSVMKKPTKVNLGSTKRSEVPGAEYGELHKSPPEINNEIMRGEGKSVMKNPTTVNLGLTKRSEVPGAACVCVTLVSGHRGPFPRLKLTKACWTCPPPLDA